MLRNLSAMAGCAALAAFMFVAIPALKASAPAPVEKSDRADLTDCIQQGWPYYARGCLRDEARNAGRATSVRLISPDRIDAATAEAAAGPAGLISELRPERIAPRAPVAAAIEAPAGWPMGMGELRVYLAAGDFIRRTVPRLTAR